MVIGPHDIYDEQVGKKGDNDAKHDVKLEQYHQTSAGCGRRDFGNVDRRDDRRSPHAQPADKPKSHKQVPVGRKRCTEGTDKEYDSDNEQRLFTADGVGRDTPEESPDDGANERDRHSKAMLQGTEVPVFLDGLFGARYNYGVEAEKESAKGYNNGPKYYFALDHSKKIYVEGLPNITFIR